MKTMLIIITLIWAGLLIPLNAMAAEDEHGHDTHEKHSEEPDAHDEHDDEGTEDHEDDHDNEAATSIDADHGRRTPSTAWPAAPRNSPHAASQSEPCAPHTTPSSARNKQWTPARLETARRVSP